MLPYFARCPSRGNPHSLLLSGGGVVRRLESSRIAALPQGQRLADVPHAARQRVQIQKYQGVLRERSGRGDSR